MAREENKQVGPKKETGLRHPLGEDYIEKEGLNKRQEKKLRSMLFPEKSFKDKAIDAGKKVMEVGKDVAKKIVPLTPAGSIIKIATIIKDKTKKNTGVKVNKGDGPSKVNTGPRSNPGSSNPKSPGKKFGGRMGYKDGSVCKMATKGKGRAYGKNS
tara:strand:- start:6 stop:473 length:468 start_codon:yes stop_codon:yes gene_type:complete